MKKLILACAVLLSGMSLASAQVGTYKVSSPTIVTTGDFTQPASYVPVNPAGASQFFPWYTSTRTVTNTGADTIKQKLSGVPNVVSTWVHVNQVSGTNTSCKIRLYASADSARGADWVQIDSATVSGKNPVDYYQFNTANGWGFTNIMWTFSGTGTQTSTWCAGLLVR